MPDLFSQDLHQISDQEAEALCQELRRSLLATVSQTGGHLASNLGAVELTVAIHRVYDTAKDRLVFDVGHQCYCHKILTGRADRMTTLRKMGGLSGFPKPEESEHDAFIAGHASNSVSVAVGMARARTLQQQDYQVIALIGDGALTGGLAYEGLSNAGQSGENLVVILNDNGMSIQKNVGGIATLLARNHLRPTYLSFKRAYRKVFEKIPGGRVLYHFNHKIKKSIKGTILPSSFFEDMGFTYIGPVDGHQVGELTRLLRWAKSLPGPVLVHVRTVKGKGWPHAEETPDAYHGVSPFDLATGKPLKASGQNFSSVFGEELSRLAVDDRKICAVTAAMRSGTGLDPFAIRCPERFFDVGIAEGHAVAMCSGMAKQGMLPVFAVYSSFLQRGYDMLIHDMALQGLHMVLGVDRAGLVGDDGETHQGLFDVAYLSTVPGLTLLAPASFAETRSMLHRALYELDGPVALRYARGGENGYSADHSQGAAAVLREGSDWTAVCYGTMTGEVLAAAEALDAEGISVEVVKLNQLAPLAPETVLTSVRKTGRLLVAEEVIQTGSLGVALAGAAAAEGLALKALELLNTGDQFVPHGTIPQLREKLGINSDHIASVMREAER